MTTDLDYTLFHQFLESYTGQGFLNINSSDELMIALEQLMEKNNQFFYIADIIQMKVLYTSKRSKEMIGIEPQEVSPYFFMEATHPKDIQRLNLGRAKLIKLAQEIFIKGSGNILLSSNFNVRNTKGTYTNLFIQCYLFYSDTPDKTVYFLKIHTDIDWCKKIKNGFHYYLGNDYSFFRYPDEEIFSLGNVFTSRELEIINLVRLSLSSEQIAEELFLSPYTINTHRANILKKSGHAKISELIIDLIEKGIL